MRTPKDGHTIKIISVPVTPKEGELELETADLFLGGPQDAPESIESDREDTLHGNHGI